MKFKIKKKPLEYDIKDKRRFAFIPTKVTPEPQGKGDEDYYVWLECYQQQYIYSYGEVTIWDGKKRWHWKKTVAYQKQTDTIEML